MSPPSGENDSTREPTVYAKVLELESFQDFHLEVFSSRHVKNKLTSSLFFFFFFFSINYMFISFFVFYAFHRVSGCFLYSFMQFPGSEGLM